MIFGKTASGILVPQATAEPAPKPPEHPSRQAIRNALEKLADDLGAFEQTTHGRIKFFDGIDDVVREIAECYSNPTAYHISNLSQAIRAFVKNK